MVPGRKYSPGFADADWTWDEAHLAPCPANPQAVIKGAAMGLETVGRYVYENFTLIYMRDPASAFELELTVNHGRTAPHNLGNGYGHFAVAVDDLDAARARMEAISEAPGPIREMQWGGVLLGRFFIKDPDGYSIEVLQQCGRFGEVNKKRRICHKGDRLPHVVQPARPGRRTRWRR